VLRESRSNIHKNRAYNMVVSMQSLHFTAKLLSTAQGEILNVTSAKMEFTFAYILGESGDHPTHGRSIQPSIANCAN
jgi:hypothetical protein